ncbi:MAG: hypothetical protein KatS3mg059_1436 [Thermomicrobiales bacterium]|nr:MAG: hypothetical protein KatS3mg059_1436 [Thermomicrobiales bacterium]
MPRRLAAAALPALAFRRLGCVHVELRDRWLTDADASGLGYGHRRDVGFDARTFEVDLAADEDAIFGRMASACRRAIRKAEKSGVTIEEAHGVAFADEFYDQLREVFLRQGLVPTYDVERVRALIRHLQPAGMLLLLRARDPEGRCIATGIFPAFNDMMFFWGGASYRAFQHYRPNEALHWYAMRYWKARGVRRYDLGGYMDYKRKYGGVEIAIPGYRQSRVMPGSRPRAAWRRPGCGRSRAVLGLCAAPPAGLDWPPAGAIGAGHRGGGGMSRQARAQGDEERSVWMTQHAGTDGLCARHQRLRRPGGGAQSRSGRECRSMGLGTDPRRFGFATPLLHRPSTAPTR